MKKVAVFLNNLKCGGAERIVSYLLNEGCKEFEFHLILMEKVIDYDIPEDIKIIQLEKTVTPGYLNVLKMPSLSRKLHRYLELHKIDTLFALLNRPNLIACRIKKMGWKGKVIISERADTIAYYRSRRFGSVMLKMVKKFYPVADHITVISEGIAESLKGLGINDVTVIYNPINILKDEEIIPAQRNGAFTYINVARFYAQKNHALLLNAFARVKNKNSRLLLLGKGVLMNQMKDLAKKLNIENRVEFLGFQRDVDGYLRRSDCFVFSSDFEGLGNGIIEAMNNGVPVISTDCPHGPREILGPDTIGKPIGNNIEYAKYGVLVPVRNVKLLADAMDKMNEDSNLRENYIYLSRQRVQDFDIKKVARKYFDIF